MRPITILLAPSAANAANIVASASIGAAGPLILTTLAGTGFGTLGRILIVTSTQTETSGTFLITGTNANGVVISETVSGVTATPVATVNYYNTVTSITTNQASVGNVEVGTRNTTLVGESQWAPLNFYERTPPTIIIIVTGTVNYTVLETYDDLLGLGTKSVNTFPAPAAITAQTASASAQLTTSATGCVLVINTYSTGATLTMRIVHTLNFAG